MYTHIYNKRSSESNKVVELSNSRFFISFYILSRLMTLNVTSSGDSGLTGVTILCVVEDVLLSP